MRILILDLPPTTSPMDRKDALTRRPLDFDQEEETRKMETSKWLENHFGSESRSSRDSLVEEEEPQQQPPKTSYFNVTIKSQPPRIQEQSLAQQSSYSVSHDSRQEPERDRNYFQGVSEWSERRKELYTTDRRFSPVRERTSPLGSREYQKSPVQESRVSPPHHYEHRVSPVRETTPTPPQRKKAMERRQRISQDSRYDSGYRTPSRNETRDSRDEPLEEPPPDYSPPSPPQPPVEKKHQKTRFAVEPVKHKSGNIIGQSIRKLVGKIRSASAERKARQRAKRSPSPSYQKGHVIDNNINNHHDVMDGRKRAFSPVHRYYLGEDPFGGSIYGRENKYDGVKPVRNSRKQPGRDEDNRSQSTLGRFSKSTGRLVSTSTPNNQNRFSQTLPRHSTRNEVPSKLENKSNSTINVSIINTVSSPQQRPLVNGGPAKPARTYKSNLARSQSFNVQAGDLSNRRTMHKSNPQLNRLDEAPSGLKSPALISSINRSTQNLSESYEENYNVNNTHSRFARNGYSDHNNDNKKIMLKGLREKTPEFFKTLHENENDWKSSNNYNKRNYNPDIYEPPTRLRDSISPTTASRNIIRRGSSSSNDYSETYRTTSRGDDPHRPSITNTVQSFSKKTIPNKDGRGFQTIESTEKKSVTKSRYVAEPHNTRYYDSDRRYSSAASPVVIEVRNNYRK
ncbi:hypothetical protein MML48_8g00001079 [Holotrichia oblita]|uniref:Uncharacterized protein n=1 Tax=Holotrichia oblita TaxID=644536 RepID=A0ACB9SMI1_HOLOL|nr:hypothetical protein MML48_8g00001079 [Holotrichia oblita]